MGYFVLMVLLIVAAVGVGFAPLDAALKRFIRFVTWLGAAGSFVAGLALGMFAYNDAGMCQHIRTIWGAEKSECNTGWFVSGYGKTTAWPHYITIAHTNDPSAEGSVIKSPYEVRLADNWTGRVSQSARFGLPQDEEQFLRMAREFRSPERLRTTTLVPAVEASMDSVANMFTMEEYYSGGARDQFKTEYENALKKGRAKVRQVEVISGGTVNRGGQSASDEDFAQDDSSVGSTKVSTVKMEKVLDTAGNVVRNTHAYAEFGIVASQAELMNIDPDDEYERQINDRKAAASRRVVAREQRREQEEQRLLEIQRGETEIAKKQAAAKVEQIQRTTDAETTKKLALIKADQMREEAEIQRDTAAIGLEKARIDAEAVQVAADAEAYAKNAILEADGALQQKLDAYVEANRVWASAAAQINVPQTVFQGGAGGEGGNPGSALSTVDNFMQMMMVKAAKDLQVDPTIVK